MVHRAAWWSMVGAGSVLLPFAPALAQPTGPLAADAIAAAQDPDFAALLARIRQLQELERRQAAQLDRALADLTLAAEVNQALEIAREVNSLQLDIDVETAKLELKRSEEKLAQAEARLRDLERRRDLSKPDSEVDAAQLQVRLAQRNVSSDRYGVELAELGRRNQLGPSPDYFRDFLEAQRRFDAIAGELDATQIELAGLLGRFVTQSLAYPPPHLARVEARVGGVPIYLARWGTNSDSTALTDEERTALEETEAQLLRENQRIAAGQDEARGERTALLVELEALRPRIEALAGRAGAYREWAVWGNILIESIGTVAAVYATGGIAAIPALIEKLGTVAPRAIDLAASIPAAKFSAATIMSQVVGSTSGVGQPAGFADPASASRLGSAANATKAGVAVIVGDVFETGIAPIAITGITAAALGKTAALSDLKEGFDKTTRIAVATSLAKAVTSAAAEYFASEAEREFAQVVIEAGLIAASLDASRQAMRPADDRYRDNVKQIARIRLTLALGKPAIALSREIDRAIPETAREEGRQLDLTLAFSRPLSRAPRVRVGGIVALEVARDGADGSQWKARASLSDLSLRVPVPIEVELDPADRPYARLDSQPSSLPQFDFPTLAWSKIESGADRNHVLQSSKADFDLTGIWGYYAEHLIERNGEEVTIRWRRRDPIVAIEAGAPFFQGLLAGDRLTGKVFSYPPRTMGGRTCSTPAEVAAVWIVADDATTGRPYSLRGEHRDVLWLSDCQWRTTNISYPVLYRDIRSPAVPE